MFDKTVQSMFKICSHFVQQVKNNIVKLYKQTNIYEEALVLS